MCTRNRINKIKKGLLFVALPVLLILFYIFVVRSHNLDDLKNKSMKILLKNLENKIAINSSLFYLAKLRNKILNEKSKSIYANNYNLKQKCIFISSIRDNKNLEWLKRIYKNDKSDVVRMAALSAIASIHKSRFFLKKESKFILRYLNNLEKTLFNTRGEMLQDVTKHIQDKQLKAAIFTKTKQRFFLSKNGFELELILNIFKNMRIKNINQLIIKKLEKVKKNENQVLLLGQINPEYGHKKEATSFLVKNFFRTGRVGFVYAMASLSKFKGFEDVPEIHLKKSKSKEFHRLLSLASLEYEPRSYKNSKIYIDFLLKYFRDHEYDSSFAHWLDLMYRYEKHSKKITDAIHAFLATEDPYTIAKIARSRPFKNIDELKYVFPLLKHENPKIRTIAAYAILRYTEDQKKKASSK